MCFFIIRNVIAEYSKMCKANTGQVDKVVTKRRITGTYIRTGLNTQVHVSKSIKLEWLLRRMR